MQKEGVNQLAIHFFFFFPPGGCVLLPFLLVAPEVNGVDSSNSSSARSVCV